jgi:hypothetical protein
LNEEEQGVLLQILRGEKQFNLRWKRMKKGLAKKKDETEFDATGFDWQPIGSTTVIASSRSKRINVVGFLNPSLYLSFLHFLHYTNFISLRYILHFWD